MTADPIEPNEGDAQDVIILNPQGIPAHPGDLVISTRSGNYGYLNEQIEDNNLNAVSIGTIGFPQLVEGDSASYSNSVHATSTSGMFMVNCRNGFFDFVNNTDYDLQVCWYLLLETPQQGNAVVILNNATIPAGGNHYIGQTFGYVISGTWGSDT
jgi:hypothetical protein